MNSFKSRCKNHHIRGTRGQLQSHQRTLSGGMWTSPQTTCCRETIRTNDGRKHPSIRIRVYDGRKRRQKTTLQTENLRTSCLRLTRILSVTVKNVNILPRVPRHLPCIPRIQSHPMGNNTTNPSINGQQISNKIFPNKDNTTCPLECL